MFKKYNNVRSEKYSDASFEVKIVTEQLICKQIPKQYFTFLISPLKKRFIVFVNDVNLFVCKKRNI